MTMNRKEFLKLMAGGAAAGAAGAVALPRKAGAEIAIEPNPNAVGMLIDLSRCIGCRSCEAACNEANGLGHPESDYETDAVFDKLRRTDKSHFTIVNKRAPKGEPVFVKSQCMHCSEPACVSVCPAAAFKKTKEGPVTYNPDVCIGCRYCMQACPFSVPAYEYDSATSPRVRKCEMCVSRVEDGDMPACAQICPQEAVVFGRREILLTEARKRLEKDPAYVQHVYGEKELGGTGVLYISKVPFEDLGFPSLPDEPLPRMTYGFLSTIPVLHTTLPVILAGFYLVTRRRTDDATTHPSTGKEARHDR